MIDVEIVGASFAGLACARTCAARGLRTVVWERKSDVGLGVRTTGLLVKEAADEEDLPVATVRRIHGVRLYAPSHRFVDLDSPGYHFLATDTPALLRSMAEGAAAVGAEIRCGTTFRAAMRTGRMLVGADGPRSAVALQAGLGSNRRFLTGVEAEFEPLPGLERRLHVFLDTRLAPGYIGWVVPGVGITQIGLATRAPIRPDLDVFVEQVSATIGGPTTARIATRGGPIPVGGTVRPFANHDTVLVGDAAGLVSPLTAGGIHTALRSGRAAGISIASHLLDGGPPPQVALAGRYPTFRWKRMMRRAMDVGVPNFLLDVGLASPHVIALARAVFFHHRGLLSAEAWRDLSRPSPARGGGGER